MANKHNQDEYGDFAAKRNKTMKIVTWVAIIALLFTTAVTFGVVPLLTN